jgi:RimJ/RimL family protein N-acetyltransferase
MLRPVEPGDIAIFFADQDDPAAGAMAAVGPRERAAHAAHWASVLADDTTIVRTIVAGDEVVGHVTSYVAHGERHVGYWIGRAHWGRGHATRALTEYLAEMPDRPLHARVAEHNVASLRVLDRCGFEVVGEAQEDGAAVKEILLRRDT